MYETDPSRAVRTLNPYQFGWVMATLGCQFSTREFLCGDGIIRWEQQEFGQAHRLEHGDWRVTFWNTTPRQRRMQEKFNRLEIR